MRLIITATRQGYTSATVYLSQSGFTTYNAGRAYVLKTEREALAELDYRRTTFQGYCWQIEKLPATGSVSSAALRAVPMAESSAGQ